MKVKTVIAVECPECGELIAGTTDKNDLEVRDLWAEHNKTCSYLPDTIEAYLCTNCEEVYEDEDEAKECCRD